MIDLLNVSIMTRKDIEDLAFELIKKRLSKMTKAELVKFVNKHKKD